jgi:hypothetical protein
MVVIQTVKRGQFKISVATDSLVKRSNTGTTDTKRQSMPGQTVKTRTRGSSDDEEQKPKKSSPAANEHRLTAEEE